MLRGNWALAQENEKRKTGGVAVGTGVGTASITTCRQESAEGRGGSLQGSPLHPHTPEASCWPSHRLRAVQQAGRQGQVGVYLQAVPDPEGLAGGLKVSCSLER